MKPSDSWSDLLSVWRVEPRSDPQFRAAVWARLQRGETESWPAYLRRHAALAAGAAALLTVTGGWAGHWQGQRQTAQDRAVLAQVHLEQLDARFKMGSEKREAIAP